MVKFVLPQLALHIKKPNIDHNKKNQAFGLGFLLFLHHCVGLRY